MSPGQRIKKYMNQKLMLDMINTIISVSQIQVESVVGELTFSKTLTSCSMAACVSGLCLVTSP